MKIMFICTGNTCRSAMAEAILKDRIDKNNLDIEVYSCGIFAMNGDGAPFNAIEVMKNRGIDLREHRATNIRDSKIKEMDLILCATDSHKINVINLYPELEDKIYTICEYADIDGDIEDPWGYDVEIYEKCAEELEECIDIIVEKL